MSKTWKTKRKILKLITEEAKTPGEISAELNLAPSTVSEHIEDLERMGAITQIENPHVRKWKYYKANPEFNAENISEPRGIRGIRGIASMPRIATVLVLAIALLGIFAYGFTSISSGNQVAFQLTDPPKVPAGTQALNITYSSLQAHYVGSGGASGWISGSGSGSLDLMALINASQVIGTGKVPVNATIDKVSFNITSATIVINGTAHSVTVPSGKLTTAVNSSGKATANSSVLIDMSPVVATIYTQNSTVFVMVPSLKAVFIGNMQLKLHLGQKKQLNNTEQDELARITPSISVSSESLIVTNNATTTFTVTVKNNGNNAITIRHVVLYGQPTVYVTSGIVPPPYAGAAGGSVGIGGSATANASSALGVEIAQKPGFLQLNSSNGLGLNASGAANSPASVASVVTASATASGVANSNFTNTGVGAGVQGTSAIQTINGIKVHVVNHGNFGVGIAQPAAILNATAAAKLNTLVRVGYDIRMLQSLNFLVTSNGTLILPQIYPPVPLVETQINSQTQVSAPVCACPLQTVGSQICNCPIQWPNYGYVLQPGASATFTFSGQILYGNGHIRATPVPGSKWRIVVAGDYGAAAYANVTATAAATSS